MTLTLGNYIRYMQYRATTDGSKYIRKLAKENELDIRAGEEVRVMEIIHDTALAHIDVTGLDIQRFLMDSLARDPLACPGHEYSYEYSPSGRCVHCGAYD